ncbi:MDR family oxidoreductase [Algihabitans sp.]|uniref:acrylyl-CoA reductase (NADPH) n=1 Tax=Algihabitans sp. TaxID=2821514 RepID=UPI003BA8B9B1
MFHALMLHEAEGGKVEVHFEELEIERLPEGDVLVEVDYSTLNYKDGLVLKGLGRLVRSYPHIPGVDFAGTVADSSHADFKPGDRVVLNGWRVGELHWGGYAQKARVKGDWLVKLPSGLTSRQAMAIGTAGYTSMLSVMALEAHGIEPASGPILVTGAAGGVGSVAVAILAKLGYRVAAVTGRPEAKAYLTDLGASEIVPRDELAEPPSRPLDKERWAGCIDAVGGTMLARVLSQMAYRGSVAAVGLAGGNELNTTVIPFLLRGVNLLGIDSVMCPKPQRETAWQRLAKDLPLDKLAGMEVDATLTDLPGLAGDILQGKVRGRVVVDLKG